MDTCSIEGDVGGGLLEQLGDVFLTDERVFAQFFCLSLPSSRCQKHRHVAGVFPIVQALDDQGRIIE